jgi:dTDP-glucose 4,6-dehydratase
VLATMGADWSSVQPVDDRKGHDRRYSVNDGKLRALGYAPEHRFEDGLAETVQWYKDNEAWWRPLKAKAAI